ncbi:MAG: hypothetical protein ACOYXA_05305 [Bacteroidota bacterium]
MTKSTISYLVLMSFTPLICLRAQQLIPNQLRSQMTMEMVSDVNAIGRNDILYGIPAEPGRTIGDYYLNETWNLGTIALHGTELMIENRLLKYDLKEGNIEILVGSSIKILEVKKIRTLYWTDSISRKPVFFIDGSRFRFNGAPVNKLLEVVSDGKIPLLAAHELVVKKPTYNAALDIGSKDVTILKKKSFYFSQGEELVKLGSKKKLLPVFGTQSGNVEEFINKNKLSIGNPDHLKQIFDYFNSITPKT